MGLDMYLSREYYVKNWEHMSKEEKHTITIQKGTEPSNIPTDKIANITTEEIYWRKANAIHNWFVKNVQDGNDDCGYYYVGEGQLQKLLDTINTILAERDEVMERLGGHPKAAELLPTQEGFFFGSTEYDDDYYQDLIYTQEELTRVLSIKDNGSFKYHSSW